MRPKREVNPEDEKNIRIHKWRVNKPRYAIIPNATIRDKDLTAQEFRLLCLMVSNESEEFEIHFESEAKKWGYSFEYFRKLFRGLRKKGYAKTTRSRNPDGTFDMQHEIWSNKKISQSITQGDKYHPPVNDPPNKEETKKEKAAPPKKVPQNVNNSPPIEEQKKQEEQEEQEQQTFFHYKQIHPDRDKAMSMAVAEVEQQVEEGSIEPEQVQDFLRDPYWKRLGEEQGADFQLQIIEGIRARSQPSDAFVRDYFNGNCALADWAMNNPELGDIHDWRQWKSAFRRNLLKRWSEKQAAQKLNLDSNGRRE